MDALDFLETAIYNHVFRNIAFTSPTGIFLRLTTTSITEAGGGSEVVGGSYGGQAITASAPSDGAGTNTNAISFPAMPACTVVGYFIADDATAGNRLMGKDLATPITVAAGETLPVPIGSLTLAVR